jgi:hypothetical protein
VLGTADLLLLLLLCGQAVPAAEMRRSSCCCRSASSGCMLLIALAAAWPCSLPNKRNLQDTERAAHKSCGTDVAAMIIAC